MSVAAKSARSIFLEAVESVPAAEWPQFLDSACGDNPDLRNEVTRLLDAHGRLSGFMAHPAISPTPGEAAVDLPAGDFLGQTIGRYKLLEQIGEGGMGVVYVAQQTHPVRRLVALKIIKPGMDSRQVIARFEAERQALALMDHPNIARILDAGTVGDRQEGTGDGEQGTGNREQGTEADDSSSPLAPRPSPLAQGRPYFVMELVRGLPITEYCDQARLTPRQRLALFINVCLAVQHAHQKGIIHRDIKPSNVLVTHHDGEPVIKVIDFGVAKALHQSLTDETIYTQFSQMIGTPLYMSPEQAELGTLDIDTRSDVYSLGVLLYELLTGRTPFDAAALKKAGYDEMRRIIREDEPPRPSARLSTLGAPLISTIAQHRGLDHRRLSQHLRGELDWIVMKCLEKDRNRRYESASSLAADLERYLREEPVHAAPPSTLYRVQKFLRRHAVATSVATSIALAIIAGVSVATWQAILASQAEHRAEKRFDMAKEAVDKYLLEVTRDEQLQQPAFRELRRRLLEAAAPFYERLSRERSTDPKQQAQRAEALHNLGQLQTEMGLYLQAHANLVEAEAIYRQLEDDPVLQAFYRWALARVLVSRGDLWRKQDEKDKALALYMEVYEMRYDWYLASPLDPQLRHDLAEVSLKAGTGRVDENAAEFLKSAGEIWQELAQKHPHDEKYQEHLALAHQASAYNLAARSPDEAHDHHYAAVRIRANLAQRNPESVRHAISLAMARDATAQANEDASVALAWRQIALVELMPLVRKYPDRIDIQVEWGRLLHLSANDCLLAWLRSHQSYAARVNELTLTAIESRYQEAIDVQEKLITQLPGIVDYEAHLAGTQLDYAYLFHIRGQPEFATRLYADAKDQLQRIAQRSDGHALAQRYLNGLAVDLSRINPHASSEWLAAANPGLERDETDIGNAAPPDLAILQRDPRRGQLTGLVSYWTGDNTPDDSVGPNHGMLVGATYAPGKIGQAFCLDGVDDRIVVADSASLMLTKSLSIEAWIQVNTPVMEGSDQAMVLFRGDDRGGRDPYQLSIDHRGCATFGIADETESAGVAAPIPLQQFVHVVGTLDDATGHMALYVDGELAASNNTTIRPLGELDSYSNAVGIGSHGGFPFTAHEYRFNGLIDELKLYDIALTADQVRANFLAAQEAPEDSHPGVSP